MKIRSQEKWNDGTLVPWEVEVHEVEVYQEGWYDRDAKTNAEYLSEGAVIRAFVVDKVLTRPDEARSDNGGGPIAGCEFLGVEVGRELTVFMNYREYCEKTYGSVSDDFSRWPTLISLQDCGFDVEVVE